MKVAWKLRCLFALLAPAWLAAAALAQAPWEAPEVVISDEPLGPPPARIPGPLAPPVGLQPLAPAAPGPGPVQHAFQADDDRAASQTQLTAGQRPLRAETTRFQDVEPGVTSLAELKQHWGEPVGTAGEPPSVVLTFHRDGAERVEVVVDRELVNAVVIHLAAPILRGEAVKQLELDGLEGVDILDDQQRRLGEVFPERGVLLSYGEQERAALVEQIVLEPLSAEPFLLRVASDRQFRYRRSLADLDMAIHLEPNNPRAFALRAELLEAAGRPGDAVGAAAEASRLAPENTAYQLLWARLLLVGGQAARASDLARGVVESEGDSPERKARAACLLGDIVLASAPGKQPDAVVHYTSAIKLAAAAASEPRAAIRREAKQVLLDAHLGMAEAIASGKWQKKQEATARWLGNAAQFAEDLIENEGREDSLRFLVSCRSLAIYAGEPRQFDPAPAAAAVREGGERLLAAASDTLRAGEIRAHLALALARAAYIEHSRGAPEKALAYAREAAGAFEQLPASRQPSRQHDFELGRVCFVSGFVYSQKRNDHQQAVAWFEKAAPLLAGPLPSGLSEHEGAVGEWFVSMGVSYWQTGRREQAVQLTEQGAQRVQAAVRTGRMEEKSLAVPYSNLATMFKSLGHAPAAQNYAAMAALIEKEGAR